MELSDYLAGFRRHWKSIVAFALVGVILAAIVSLLTTPTYTSRVSVLFAVQSASSAGDLAQGTTYAEKQVQSYAEVATAPVVLQPVIEQLGLDATPSELAGSVTATVPARTVIVDIAVEHEDRALAADIANSIGAQLSQAVLSLTPKTSDGQDAVRATVISPALPATAATSPRVATNLLLGLLAGLALGAGLAILRDQLDTRIRTVEDVEAVSETPVIGSIPLSLGTTGPTVVEDPKGASAEAYRRLRTNLQFLNLDHERRPLVITSSIPGEGKSVTSINLALTLAEEGKSVLLIDADLRRPVIAQHLRLEQGAGLTTVLIGRADFDDVVQPLGPNGLHVLTCGAIPPNPSELLGSGRMSTLLEEVSNRYEVVVIDTPPLLPVTDSAVLARLVGGAVMVVGAGKAHREQLRDAVATLGRAGAELEGFVLNMVRRGRTEAYAYDYGYRSAPTSEEKSRARARKKPTEVSSEVSS